jgi:hypothetical protein
MSVLLESGAVLQSGPMKQMVALDEGRHARQELALDFGKGLSRQLHLAHTHATHDTRHTHTPHTRHTSVSRDELQLSDERGGSGGRTVFSSRMTKERRKKRSREIWKRERVMCWSDIDTKPSVKSPPKRPAHQLSFCAHSMSSPSASATRHTRHTHHRTHHRTRKEMR